MANIDFPAGYRFNPSDSVVLYYLKNKIMGIELPGQDFIPEIDLYSYNPDELPRGEFKYGITSDEAFLFTYKQENRTTKDGYWRATSLSGKIGEEGDQLYGFKKKLVFVWTNQNRRIKSPWIMYEFGLNPAIFSDDELKAIGNKIGSYVLCRICYE